MTCLGQSFSPRASHQAPRWQEKGRTLVFLQAPSLLLSHSAHGPSPWPLFSSPVEAPGPGTKVREVWAQEGAAAQLPCSPTTPLQDLSLRIGGVTWQHLPDRYAPQTWATEFPNPRSKPAPGPLPGAVSPSEASGLPPLPLCTLGPSSSRQPIGCQQGMVRAQCEGGYRDVNGQETCPLGGLPYPQSVAGLHLSRDFFPFNVPISLSGCQPAPSPERPLHGAEAGAGGPAQRAAAPAAPRAAGGAGPAARRLLALAAPGPARGRGPVPRHGEPPGPGPRPHLPPPSARGPGLQ